MQCKNAKLSFCDDLWPEFSVWSFYRSIIEFQRDPPPFQTPEQFSRRQVDWLKRLEEKRTAQIMQWAKAEWNKRKKETEVDYDNVQYFNEADKTKQNSHWWLF